LRDWAAFSAMWAANDFPHGKKGKAFCADKSVGTHLALQKI